MKTKDLVYIAMYLALFLILDYMTQIIPLLQMPSGGSVGFSVVALLLASYHLGYKKGLVVALLSIYLQYLIGGIYVVHPIQFLLEYPLAFGLYGLAVLIPNTKLKNYKIYWGIIFSNLIRMVLHIVAGVYFWQAGWVGSIAYNGPYMMMTLLISFILVPLVIKRLKF
ncbi:MAG: energy-coupled thiamine transporter ThiT [Erysipelotrichaceae bacterium]|nr:energy-coupled thiamine transporter ThiT [Erysipelotrichaceae bacterium]